MGRQLIVNSRAVDIAVDAITAGQLKEELQAERNAWVVITRANRSQQLADHEVIPAEAEQVSIVPAFQYGR